MKISPPFCDARCQAHSYVATRSGVHRPILIDPILTAARRERVGEHLHATSMHPNFLSAAARSSTYSRLATGAILASWLVVACGSDEAGSTDAAGDEPGPAAPTTTAGDPSNVEPSSPDPAPTGAAPGSLPTEPTKADPALPLLGSFLIGLVAPVESSGNQGFTSVQGSIADGPPLELTLWELAASDPTSGCELLTPTTPTCTDGCGTTAGCVADETCKEYPTSKSLGEVTIVGLQTADGSNTLLINPQKPKLNYNKPAGAEVLFPPTPEGDLVVLSAAGGDFDPVQLAATGISVLEVLGPQTIPLSGEMPLLLEWVAAARGESRIDVKIDISHHGGAKGKIVCQAPDTGSLEIPAAMIDGLIDLGFSGYPTIILTRKAVGAAAVGTGRVELRLESSVERPLSIPGLTSCDSDEQCAESGQVCLPDRRCG